MLLGLCDSPLYGWFAYHFRKISPLLIREFFCPSSSPNTFFQKPRNLFASHVDRELRDEPRKHARDECIFFVGEELLAFFRLNGRGAAPRIMNSFQRGTRAYRN